MLPELPGREDYLLAGKGLAMPVHKGKLETEELGGDKQAGQVAGTVGYTVADKDQQVVADKG